MNYTRRTAISTLTAATGVAMTTGVTAQEAEIKVIEMVLGTEDAPVTLIEYASFTCSHCARFHEEVFPNLKADYIDTGKVRFVFREVYFDRFGLWAGMLARCAGPNKYFGMADLLLKRQGDWVQAGVEPITIVENMKKLGRVAGMTNEQMDACLQDADHATALVAVYQENTDAHGVDSTPSFVIGGSTYKNMSYSDLRELLDAQLDG